MQARGLAVDALHDLIAHVGLDNAHLVFGLRNYGVVIFRNTHFPALFLRDTGADVDEIRMSAGCPTSEVV